MRTGSSHKGFTLVELLVSSVVITIIGAAAWSSTSALMQANEVTRNNLTAVNLLRKSMEEVRRAAQNNFDNLGAGSCTFTANNSCNFDDTAQTFPGFTRTLRVTAGEGGSSEIKQVSVDVVWSSMGRARILTSVMLLARPPKPLPGNVIGLAANGDPSVAPGTAVTGAVVTLTKVAPPQTLSVTTTAAVTASDGNPRNYTFLSPSNQFQLEAGTWAMSATAPGFLNYTHPVPIEVVSNTEIRVNFKMAPAPVPAKITVNLTPSGGPSGVVGLYKGSAEISRVASSGTNVFTIPFTTTDQQCFTVATFDMYKSGFAGGFSCNPPRTQNPDGWSSSVVQADNSLRCGQPWTGNAGAGVDRLCVNPGDSLVVNVPLVPVATATVGGRVVDQTGAPITNTPISVLWHDNGNYPWPGKAANITTDANGNFSAVVPAEQALFPNDRSYYVQVTASAQVPFQRCCNVMKNETVTRTVRPGPLFAGTGVIGQNVTISRAVQRDVCGDAGGAVRDARTNAPVGGAFVWLTSFSSSDGAGGFSYRCPGSTPPYSLVAGSYGFTVWKDGYYLFSSSGNEYYNRFTPSGDIVVAPNTFSPVGTVSLWPIGYGTLKINVVRQGSSSPIPDAVVNISGPSGTSGNAGVYDFNLMESWPVPELVGNPRYNQTPRLYSVTVSHPAYEDAPPLSGVKVTRGGTTTVTVTLSPKGGM